MTKKEITQLSYEIVGCAITVHKALGPGLLEQIYEKCLAYELTKNGFIVQQQVRVPVIYDKLKMDIELKVDLLVNETIVIELKAVEHILPVHQAQLYTYMKILEKPQGLLINFFTDIISKSTKPLVNEFFNMLPD